MSGGGRIAGLAFATLAALLPALAGPPAEAAADGCRFADGRAAAGRFSAGGQDYLYRFAPPQLAVGRRFSVQVQACAPDPSALTGVDARMPAHRHGMNYRPRLEALSATGWRAEGLLLHMPGDWRFLFTVDGPSGSIEAAVDRKVQ